MRWPASALVVFLVWGGCNTTPPDPNALDCHPGCDAGDMCCPWSAPKVCHPDAGCKPGSGFVCVGTFGDDGCPALNFN